MEQTISAPTYNILDKAYQFFNQKLWGGKLPTCVITLRSSKKSLKGSCTSHCILIIETGEVVDSISLNSSNFNNTPPKDILSTLVHEMAHTWQSNFGRKKPKTPYHNREWANEMMRIGLYPSKTGEAGGETTGPQMSHYIVTGEMFDVYCDQFLEEFGFELGWYSLLENKPKQTGNSKYICPDCNQKAWAKPHSEIKCGKCDIEMIEEEKD